MNWFRLYAEFATDPKIQMMPETMQRRFVMLLCLQCGNGIETFHETDRETSIGFALRITPEEMTLTKAEFLRRGFINDDWTLRNWSKRQYSSDSSTVRVRKHRDKLKQEETKTRNKVKRFSNALEQNRTDTEQSRESNARGTRLPADWKPSETELRWAGDARPDLDASAEVERFADYWHAVAGSKGLKTDWAATWRNWIRRADAPHRVNGSLPETRSPAATRRLA